MTELGAQPWHFVFESLFANIDGKCLLVGWMDDRSDKMTQILAHPREGAPVDLLPHVCRYRRDDVSSALGVPPKLFDFGVWFAFDGLRQPQLGARVAITFASGRTTEIELAAILTAPIDLRDRILDSLTRPSSRPADPAQIDVGLAPLVRALHRRAIDGAIVGSRHNQAPLSEAAICVVVPLAGDAGLLQRQAAMLATAGSYARMELIYVSDAPDLQADFEAAADAAHRLYRLNIMLMGSSGEIGFARSCNEAAKAATAPILLFLNQGVIPADRDWLLRIGCAHKKLGERDVVGGLLLDSDGSIRQAGLGFRRADRHDRMWRPEPLSSGLPMHWVGGTAPRAATAVAASALLVNRRPFLDLGGFDENYLGDGYADSDFCFRVRDAGGSIVVDPSVILYDVGSVEALGARHASIALLDQALFNQRWAGQLEVLEREDSEQ